MDGNSTNNRRFVRTPLYQSGTYSPDTLALNKNSSSQPVSPNVALFRYRPGTEKAKSYLKKQGVGEETVYEGIDNNSRTGGSYLNSSESFPHYSEIFRSVREGYDPYLNNFSEVPTSRDRQAQAHYARENHPGNYDPSKSETVKHKLSSSPNQFSYSAVKSADTASGRHNWQGRISQFGRNIQSVITLLNKPEEAPQVSKKFVKPPLLALSYSSESEDPTYRTSSTMDSMMSSMPPFSVYPQPVVQAEEPVSIEQSDKIRVGVMGKFASIMSRKKSIQNNHQIGDPTSTAITAHHNPQNSTNNFTEDDHNYRPEAEAEKKIVRKRKQWRRALIALAVLGVLGFVMFNSGGGNVDGNVAGAFTAIGIENRVEQLAQVPAEETPQILQIKDAQKVKQENSSFFADAVEGDYLLIYSDRAVLYTPRFDKILKIGNLSSTI